MQLKKNNIKEQVLKSEDDKPKNILQKIVDFFVPLPKKTIATDDKKPASEAQLNGTLKEKILKMLELTDEQYSDKLLDSELR